uniref:Putative secreted protein n=1 Tax=Ixodes ricinus TaxID=34613 RepID=A0A6B0UJY9_IXORI
MARDLMWFLASTSTLVPSGSAGGSSERPLPVQFTSTLRDTRTLQAQRSHSGNPNRNSLRPFQCEGLAQSTRGLSCTSRLGRCLSGWLLSDSSHLLRHDFSWSSQCHGFSAR